MPRQPERVYKKKAPAKGNGKLKCAICKTPLRDHELGPCPKAGLQTGERLITRKPYRGNERAKEPR